MPKIPASAVLVLIGLMLSMTGWSQDCVVELAALKGTYEGDCRNGKAQGKGRAAGTDKYEGEFRAGLPDGQGTYTWSNGNSFTGKFSKGLREGKGTMIFKRPQAPDSTVTGYWRKDQYAGKNEKPWIVRYTSRSVTEVQVEMKSDGFRQVSFLVSNTSGGAISMDNGDLPRLKVDEIQLLRGNYGRILNQGGQSKKSETTVFDVEFPAYMKLSIGGEQVEIEFLEEGNYTVNIRINQ